MRRHVPRPRVALAPRVTRRNPRWIDHSELPLIPPLVRSRQPPHNFRRHGTLPQQLQPAQDAFASVLANAGATRPRRDAVDERIIRTVRTGEVTAKPGDLSTLETDLARYGYQKNTVAELTRLIPLGIITHPSQVGGHPEYKGTPHKDTDSNGLPDDWETKHFGRTGADPSADTDADGYTNIEEFLNGTDPRRAVDYTKLTNNVDHRP